MGSPITVCILVPIIPHSLQNLPSG